MRLTRLLIIPCLILSLVIDSRAAEESDESPVILAIFAHPDDETSVAPLLAKYAREGARVYLAIATDGRFGVTEHAGLPAGDELAQIRAEEAHCAADKLGINPPYFLGFQDGFSHKTDNQDQLLELLVLLHEKVRSLFAELRPQAVITWGPEGGYGHSDHRMVSNIVSEVFQEGASTWPQQLLFPGFSTDRLRNLSPESRGALTQWFADNWHPVNETFLDVRISYTDADWLAAKAALGCHASQFSLDDVEQLAKLTESLLDGAVTLRSWKRNTATDAEVTGETGTN